MVRNTMWAASLSLPQDQPQLTRIDQIKAPREPKLPFDIFPQSHHNTNLENEFKYAPLAPEGRRVEVK